MNVSVLCLFEINEVISLCLFVRADELAIFVNSVGSTEEPATKVKFQRSLSLPGSSTSLSLLGTGQLQ